MVQALVIRRSCEVLPTVSTLEDEEKLPYLPKYVLPTQCFDVTKESYEEQEIEVRVWLMPVHLLSKAIDVHLCFFTQLVGLLVHVKNLSAVKALADEVRAVEDLLAMGAPFHLQIIKVKTSIKGDVAVI